MNQPVTTDSNLSDTDSKRRRTLYLVGGAVLAVAIIGWLVLRPHGAAQAAVSEKNNTVPPLITAVTPQFGPVSTAVSVTGQISARNDIPIGIESDEGRIAAVLAEPGDRVHKGQVLARLNPITAQTQVDSATASLDELKATAAVAEAEWARTQRARDSFSVEEAERRRTSAVTAAAKVKAAEAQLADAQNRMAHTTVLAPEDGIVLTRTAEVGQIAVPGTTVLFRLARNGEIELRGQVAEQEMPLLKVGQVAEVRLDGVAQPFTGKVWQIGAIIDPTTRQGIVRIALPAADQNLRPGAFARAAIQSGMTVGAIVPQTAVLSDEQGNYAMIVNAQQKIERRAVTVAGARSEGLLVSAGLNNTDQVVAIAGAFLRIGEQVVVAPSAAVAPTAASTPAAHAPSAP
jgi:RND family efflux transporter MFP subunit